MAEKHSAKVYQSLGKLLLTKKPEVAKELLPLCEPGIRQDYSLLEKYFEEFCRFKNINPAEYMGSMKHSGGDKAQTRYLFLGAMVHIYQRHNFHIPNTYPVLRTGFVKSVSILLQIGYEASSRSIKKVLAWEKIYDHISDGIQEAVNYLMQTDVYKNHCSVIPKEKVLKPRGRAAVGSSG